MKINHSAPASANSALSAAAKKSASGTHGKNAKEFAPVAASAIESAGAPQSSSSANKVVSSNDGAKTNAGNTMELANDGAQKIKSAYNKVSSGIGAVANAAASYAQTGLSADTQAINALA